MRIPIWAIIAGNGGSLGGSGTSDNPPTRARDAASLDVSVRWWTSGRGEREQGRPARRNRGNIHLLSGGWRAHSGWDGSHSGTTANTNTLQLLPLPVPVPGILGVRANRFPVFSLSAE